MNAEQFSPDVVDLTTEKDSIKDFSTDVIRGVVLGSSGKADISILLKI